MSEQLDPITNLPQEKPTLLDFSNVGKVRISEGAAYLDPKTEKNYNDYSSGLTYGLENEQRKVVLSENQGSWETFGNSLGRITANVLPEIAKGIGYLEDVVTGTPDGNSLTDAMTNLTDSVNNNYALYGDPSNKIINGENISGLVTSMASFAALGMGIGGVIGNLGRIGKAGSSLQQGMGALSQLTTATALTGIEGAMEANQLLKNSYTQEFNKLYVENINKGLDEFTAKNNADVTAKRNVESAAKTAMFTNYLNVALNLTSAGYFIKGASALDDVGRMVKSPAKFLTKKTGAEFIREGAQEALEEGVNVFAGAAGKNQLEGGKYTFQDIWDNVDKDELKTSMILGAIGGIGQTAISSGIKNIDSKWYKGKDVVLREKYAEQKDFMDRVKTMYDNPKDFSENVLNVTHTASLLQQAQEFEDAGNTVEAQKVREIAIAYQAHESFKNGTWKDLKDVYTQLVSNDQLTDVQKENAKKAASLMDTYFSIYKKNDMFNEKSNNKFSIYANRVINHHLNEEYKSKVNEVREIEKEKREAESRLDNSVFTEAQKIKEQAIINENFNPRLKEAIKTKDDLVTVMNQNTKKYNDIVENNLDDLTVRGKITKAMKKQIMDRADFVNKAKDNEELDKALNRYEDEDNRNEALEEAASRQLTNEDVNVDDNNSFTKSISDRWQNKAALQRTEKTTLANIAGVNPTVSNVELSDALFQNNKQEEVKKFFETRNEFASNRIKEELRETIKTLQPVTSSFEEGKIPTVPIQDDIVDDNSATSEHGNITILHYEKNQFGVANTKYSPLFREGSLLLSDNTLIDQTVHFEVEKSDNNSISYNVGKDGKLGDNFTVLVVYYKDGNTENKTKENRILISKLRADTWERNGKKYKLNEALTKVRSEIKKNYKGEDIYTLPTTTTVRQIVLGKYNQGELSNPLDVLKPNENLILAVAVSKNGSLELEGNFANINFDSGNLNYIANKLIPGGVYMLIKNPNGVYNPVQLFVSKVKEIPAIENEVRTIIDELVAEGDYVVGKSIREKLNQFVHTSFTFDVSSKMFFSNRTLVDGKVVQSKEVKKLTKEQMIEVLINDRVQVSSRTINLKNKNSELANSGAIKTALQHNRYTLNNIKLSDPKWDNNTSTSNKTEATSKTNKTESKPVVKPTPKANPYENQTDEEYESEEYFNPQDDGSGGGIDYNNFGVEEDNDNKETVIDLGEEMKNKGDSFIEQTFVSDVESKKADIERRRQEELLSFLPTGLKSLFNKVIKIFVDKNLINTASYRKITRNGILSEDIVLSTSGNYRNLLHELIHKFIDGKFDIDTRLKFRSKVNSLLNRISELSEGNSPVGIVLKAYTGIGHSIEEELVTWYLTDTEFRNEIDLLEENVKNKVVSLIKEISGFTDSQIEEFISFDNSKKSQEKASENIDKINAKYDAELAALENKENQPKEESITPEQVKEKTEEVGNKVGSSKKKFGKNKDKNNTPTVKSNIQPAISIVENTIEVTIENEITNSEVEEVSNEMEITKEEAKDNIIKETKNILNGKKINEYGKKSILKLTKISKRIASVITKSLIALLIYSSVTGFTFKNVKHNLNTPIEIATSILPDAYQQSAIRQFSKMGLYDPTVNENTFDSNNIKEAKVSENSNHKEYKQSNTFTEIIGQVKDSHHKSRTNVSDSLSMIRNQYFIEDGFDYVPGAIQSNSKDGDKYNNVLGVAHFMILDDQGVDLTNRTNPIELKKASDEFRKRIGKDIKLTDYVPVFTKKGDKVNVTYKIASEITNADFILTKLVNYNLSNIDFNSKRNAKDLGFSSGTVFSLTDTTGKPIPSMLFTSAGKDAYSRFSGGGLVFIFTDNKGNKIARDFSGSINAIEKEANSIAKQFNISKSNITLGFYDAGSYTAKPSAGKDGVLEYEQWKGYNKLHPNSGGALIIPKRSLGSNKKSIWNKEKELKRLFEILPGSIAEKTKVVEEIERIGDLTTYGIFENSIITIIENAIPGTAYHEAVHAVLELLLSPKEKANLLNELNKTYTPSKEQLSFLRNLYPNLNESEIYELALEEELADNFAEFALNRDSIRKAGKEKRNLFERILYWFNNIFNVITNRNKVDRFFNNMYDGKFTKYNVKANKTRSIVDAKRSIQRNPQLLNKRLKNMKVMNFDLLEELTSKYPGKKNIDIIQELGFENYMNIILTRIFQDRQALIETEDLTAEEKETMLNSYNWFLQNIANLDTVETTEATGMFSNLDFLNNSSTITKFKLDGNLPLISTFVMYLDELGINVQMSRKNVTVKKDQTPDETLEDSENEDLTIANGYSETWQFKVNERSSESSFSGELKLFLSHIKSDKTDDLYYEEFENYTEVRNWLFDNISDIYDTDEMMDALEKGAQYKSFVNDIYQRAKVDQSFKSDLFIYIASKHDGNFLRGIKDENGNLRLIKSNRTNVLAVMIEDIKSAFATSKLLNKDGKLIQSQAIEFNKKIKNLIAEMRKIENVNRVKLDNGNYKETYNDKIIDLIVSLFDEYSFDINREQITELNNKNKNELANLINNDINRIGDYFEKGINVLSYTEEEIDKKEGSLLDRIGRKLIPVTKHKSEKSFRNIDKKTMFSHGNTNFAKEFIAKLQSNKDEMVSKYLNDAFYANSFFFKSLEDNTVNVDDLEITILDGSEFFENDPKVFDQMMPKDIALLSITAFWNSNYNSNDAYYRMGALSDAPQTAFLKYKKIRNPRANEDFWNKVYSTVLQEYDRMQFVKENKSFFDKVKNVSKRNSTYILSPFMNGDKSLDPRTSEGKAKVMELAKNYYAVSFQNELQRLLKLEIISFDNVKQEYVSGVLSRDMVTEKSKFSQDALMANLEEYFYNTTLFNGQLLTVFSGDPMYYKNNNDWQKRNKQIWSPITHLDTSNINANYVTITVRDEEINTKETNKALSTLLDKLFSNHIFKDRIISSYTKNNLTDAQSFITIDRYKEILTGLNRWTDKHEEIFNKIKSGKKLMDAELAETYADYWNIFGSMKPFDFHHNEKMIVDGQELNTIYPYQSKRAEFLLIPQVVAKSPRLKSILEKMETLEKETGMKAVLNFDSAIKDGAHNIYESFEDVPTSKINYTMLSNKRYGLQVEVPTHYVNDENNFGSQFMKLIQSDISRETIFTSKHIPNIQDLFGKDEVTFNELQELYQKMIALNLENSFNNLKGKMSNPIKLKKMLYDAGITNKLPYHYFETLGNKLDGIFTMPTWFPGFGKKNENVLHSLLKNNVLKQKFPGASLVNVSSIGYDENLKVKVDEGGLLHFEAKLPWWTRRYFETVLDEDGNIDIDLLKQQLGEQEANDILDIIAYRIPTEHKHSMFKIRVVGFMHPLQGGAIMLPAEATTISGFDFDVDKLYAMFPSIEMVDGKPTKLKYNQDNINDASKSNDYRFNAILDICKGILSHEAVADQIFEPSSFDDIKDNAFRIYLASKGNTKVFEMVNGKYTISADEIADIINNENMDLTLPSTQEEYIERNRVGKLLIGFFANHNTCHSFAQQTNLSSIVVPSFNGQKLSALNGIYNVTGRYISKVLAGFLASATDNAKDPIASFMNLNESTVDTYAYLVRLGYDPKTIQLFISQPIIKNYIDNVEKYGKYEAYDRLPYMKDILDHPSLGQYIIKKESIHDFTDEELQQHLIDNIEYEQSYKDLKVKLANTNLSKNEVNNLNESFLQEWRNHIVKDYYVIRTFEKLKQVADQLGTVSTGIKVDNANNRSTLSDTESVMDKYNDMTNVSLLKNVEDFYSNPILKSYYKYGIENARDLFENYFPWLNTGFRIIKNEIREIKGKKLMASEIEKINYLVLTHLMAENEFFNNDIEAVVSELPKAVVSYVKENKDIDNKYLPFLKRFLDRKREVKSNKIKKDDNSWEEYENGSIKSFIQVLEFYRNGLNAVEKQEFMALWEQMLDEPVGSIERTIARNLVRYAFSRSGFTVNSYSFMDLVPPSFFLKEKNKDGVSMVDYLKNKVDNLHNDNMDSIIETIIGNMYSDKGMLRTIYIKNSDVKSTYYNKENRAIGGVVLDNETVFRKLLTFSSKSSKFAEKKAAQFIMVEKGTTKYLMKLNPQSKEGNVEYSVVPTLGYKNYFVETANKPLLQRLRGVNHQYKGDVRNGSDYTSVTITGEENLPNVSPNDIAATQELVTSANYKKVSVTLTVDGEKVTGYKVSTNEYPDFEGFVFKDGKEYLLIDPRTSTILGFGKTIKESISKFKEYVNNAYTDKEESILKDLYISGLFNKTEENSIAPKTTVDSLMKEITTNQVKNKEVEKENKVDMSENFYEQYEEDNFYYEDDGSGTANNPLFNDDMMLDTNKDIMDWFIDNYERLTDKQLEMLNELGITSVEMVGSINLNDNTVFEKLNEIKCK